MHWCARVGTKLFFRVTSSVDPVKQRDRSFQGVKSYTCGDMLGKNPNNARLAGFWLIVHVRTNLQLLLISVGTRWVG
jgi:hypothetical protein